MILCKYWRNGLINCFEGESRHSLILKINRSSSFWSKDDDRNWPYKFRWTERLSIDIGWVRKCFAIWINIESDKINWEFLLEDVQVHEDHSKMKEYHSKNTSDIENSVFVEHFMKH